MKIFLSGSNRYLNSVIPDISIVTIGFGVFEPTLKLFEMADEDEVGLPQKGLNMIIKDVLPDIRIANESRELLNSCCVEFVKHVAREAQRISSNDQRKTIYHEHVQKALQNLGFTQDYIDAADSVLDECKVAAEKKLKRKNSRLDKCGIPEEQLYLMQQVSSIILFDFQSFRSL